MANNKDFKVKNGIKPTVYHEAVGTVTSGTVADITNASYDTNTSDFSNEDTIIRDIAFRQDNGQVLYVLGRSNNDIFQYNLTTGWDLSTASYSSNSFPFAQDTDGHGLGFKTDGTKMYIGGDTNNTIYQYSLSTAWDVSTASYDSKSFAFTQDIRGFQFKPDGTKLFWCMYTHTYEIDLSTAWDISTASYNGVSFDVSTAVGTDGNQNAIAVSEDGTKMFTVSSNSPDNIYQFSLSTGWDLSTASYDNINFSVTSQAPAPFGLFLKPDNTKLFVSGQTSDSAFRYSIDKTTKTLDLSTGSVFEITPTSDIQISLSNPAASGTVSQATLLLDGVDIGSSYDISIASYDSVSFSVSPQETTPTYLGFKDDGTKMYVLGFLSENLYQYSLSTAWDVSTASYLNSKNFVAQETSTTAFFIKPDGSKLYLVGTTNTTVYEYNLTTAWDTNTASYASKSFSVNSQDTIPTSLFFKPDGTKMYVGGGAGRDINEYNLSTAWDVSTASYNQTYSLGWGAAQYPTGLIFTSDGIKMFVLNFSTDEIEEHSLSTAWDVSTASYVQNFDATSQGTGMRGLSFKDDGTKMYLVSNGNDTVYAYSSGPGVVTPTITYNSAIEFAGGTAPTSPAVGDTDVLTFSTRNGGTSYQSVLAIDGAA